MRKIKGEPRRFRFGSRMGSGCAAVYNRRAGCRAVRQSVPENMGRVQTVLLFDHRFPAGYPVGLVAVCVLHPDGHGAGARFGEVDTVIVRGDPAGIVVDRVVLVETEVVGVGGSAALRGGVVTVGFACFAGGVFYCYTVYCNSIKFEGYII